MLCISDESVKFTDNILHSESNILDRFKYGKDIRLVMTNALEKEARTIILTDDPLRTGNIVFLEKILEVADGYKFIEAVQTPPYWRNIGVPTNSDERLLNEQLPGGKIVRQRYLISDIRKHYEILTRG